MFDSFANFQKRFDLPASHWAIDVYSPPEAGYKQAHDWACQLQTRGYQLGPLTIAAREAVARSFAAENEQDKVGVIFCPTGTAANAYLRYAVLDQNKSMIVYSELSHQTDREAGSVEALTGSRLLKPSDLFSAAELEQYRCAGQKYLNVAQLAMALERREDKYLNQKPALISVSVPSEDGSVPPLAYIRELADFAQAHDMLLHIDGARLFVAAAALGKTLKELTTDCGADMVTLGGSKVGMIGVEAAIFTPHFFAKAGRLHGIKDPKKDFDYLRSILKRIGGLSGRSEEGSVQMLRALTDDYGIKVGLRAHEAAKALAARLQDATHVRLANTVQSNVVLVRMTNAACEELKKTFPYMKTMQDDGDEKIVRFMSSHATGLQDMEHAVTSLEKAGEKWPLKQ